MKRTYQEYDDKSIASVVKDMVKDNKSMEDMRRVTGLPYEKVDVLREQAKRQLKKKGRL